MHRPIARRNRHRRFQTANVGYLEERTVGHTLSTPPGDRQENQAADVDHALGIIRILCFMRLQFLNRIPLSLEISQ